ncbi:hypothetical protein EYF80_041998 [Liparis tanakae]|uniref:Uncharacterized protein n=1 Tax=Liparis tanakae TaxID=230148 RepID=A0A4Z2G3C0_9TELE|nr:hypothetical protein EYF80_041998 [Liparis tanakae]
MSEEEEEEEEEICGRIKQQHLRQEEEEEEEPGEGGGSPAGDKISPGTILGVVELAPPTHRLLGARDRTNLPRAHVSRSRSPERLQLPKTTPLVRIAADTAGAALDTMERTGFSFFIFDTRDKPAQ